jgi:TRAP-type C4-dicarboxylate transport system permease small subunit
VQYAPDHPRATTALVLGILGMVACGVLAPFAWSIGKRAVTEIDASQGRLGGRGTANAGYILGVIGSILLGLGILFAVLVLGFGILGLAAGVSTAP